MTSVLVIGPAGDPTVPEAFQLLEIRAEKVVREQLETRGHTTRFVDTTRPPLAPQAEAFDDVGGLVLLGGGDVDPTMYGLPADQPNLAGVDRSVDEYAVAAVHHARRAGLPILGICRGAQVLNVAFSGTLIPDITDWAIHHGPTPETIFVAEEVTLSPGSRLATTYQTTALTVRNGHHQAVDRVADGFVATGRAADGIVEAIESADPNEWIVGMQWHPEHADADPDALRQLFDAYTAVLTQNPVGAQS